MIPVYAHVRPWRNNNPGDLRTLSGGEKWDGQIGIDNDPGGPFCIFETRVMGWRALAKLLLTYYDVHGLKTIRDIVGRFAPAADGNDEDSYVACVARSVGSAPDFDLYLHNDFMMLHLCEAIAIMEGGARIPWDHVELEQGVALALSGTA